MINVKIGNIAEFINGVAFKPEDWSVEGKKIIRIQNLTDPSKEYNRTQREVHPKYKIQKGDVLVSWSATIDVFIWNNEDALLNQHIFKVNFDTNKVFKNYFVYALKETINELNKLAHGSTMRHIIKSDFENHQIPLPSYENQIKIANVLERIENLIKERQNTIDLLDELVKATFYQMFGDPVKNEKGWDKDILNNLGSLDRGVSKHRPRNAPELLGGIYPLIQTGDVARSSLWLKEYTQTYSELGLKQSKIWPKGTLLITIAANIGKTSILSFDACFPDSIVGFISNEKKSNVIFVHYLLGLYQETLEKNAPQSAQKNINLGILRELILPTPPVKVQNKFAVIAQKIESIKVEQEAQKKVMEELYASITQKVFNDEDFDLSRVPFDASLLPKEEDVTVIEKEVKQQEKSPKEKIKKPKIEKNKQGETVTKLKGLSWENISFEVVANEIKKHYQKHYFNSEMLLRYLTEDLGIIVNYFSSVEEKKNPQLESADDFYSFIATSLTGENYYLNLQQVFYNAEEENIEGITFTATDLENLSKKDIKNRSGIYFYIKDETITR